MDKRTRGSLEKKLDAILETNITDAMTMRWVLDEFPIRSPEELALGYVLGSLSKFAHTFVRRRKLRLHRKSYDLTEKDEIEIRDMLRRRIPDIVNKINQELNR